MSDHIIHDSDRPSKPKRVRQESAVPPPDAIPIPGYPGYLVDRHCRIYSCWRGRMLPRGSKPRREIFQSGTWYLLRAVRNPGGFHIVRVRDEGGRFASASSHRLGLIAHAGPAPRKRAVAIHVNGNRDDNRIENLEWLSRARPKGLAERRDPDPSWRPIPGFPGYIATPDGEIYSFRSTRAIPGTGKKQREAFIARQCKRLSGRKEHLGYASHYLRGEDGQGAKVWTHRAILMAFVGPPPEGCEARHLDGNPSNNRIENLAWGTPAENAADKARHGTAPIGVRHGMSKLSEEDVRTIRALRESGESSRSIASRFGVSSSRIDSIVARRAWRHLC